MTRQNRTYFGMRAGMDARQIFQMMLVLMIGITLTWSATLESVKLSRANVENRFERDASDVAGRIWSNFNDQIDTASDLAAFVIASDVAGDDTAEDGGIGRFRAYLLSDPAFAGGQHFVGIANFEGDSIRLPRWYLDGPNPKPSKSPAELLKLLYSSGLAERLLDALDKRKPLMLVLDDVQRTALGLTESFLTLYPFERLDGRPSMIVISTEFRRILQDVAGDNMLRQPLVHLGAGARNREPLIARDFRTGEVGQTVARSQTIGGQLLVYRMVQEIGGQQWFVEIWPSDGVYTIDYGGPLVTASVVLLLTALVCYIIYNQSERASRVVEIVNRRTRALKEAHQELEENYNLLQSLNKDLDDARQSAEIANAAKSEFIATVSHELRTPLNAVLGFSQLLRDQTLGPLGDERYGDYARDIYDSGSYLLQLINDILDLAKLEAGKIKLEYSAVSISRLISRVENLMDQGARGKNLELRFDIDPDVPESFLGDELRLRQVLLNLVSNAIKFTSQGHVLVAMCCEQRSSGEMGLRFTVEDTGIGIPEDKLAKLFERFTQVDTTRARMHAGAGLGLAICRELVSMMEGEIRVQSQVDKGTVFTVHIPLYEAEESSDDTPEFI